MNAVLVLEDGTIIEGRGFGADATVSGEVIFNTGMVGYPESITDPSYHGQILCQTYPLMGNYGINPSDFESPRPQISGYVVQENCHEPSHFSSEKTLDTWLKENGIPGISGIDTRELTKRLRTRGVMLGIMQTGSYDIRKLLEDVKTVPDPNKRDLVSEVTVREEANYGNGKPSVVLIDCGAKMNIIRCLLKRDVSVTRVPAGTGFDDIVRHNPDGVVISNGPGDPAMCRDTILSIRKLIERDVPTFGICLGNQLLAHAAGAETYKLPFGHRSQNQPCVEAGTQRCYITSQNHGFAVRTESLPDGWQPWFTNLNDGTNEGIRHEKKPFMGVQFHPEASPGPTDTEFLFDDFIRLMNNG